MNYTELVESKIAEGFWTYMSPCILVIGLVGNILVFVVLSKSSMRQTTTSLYLRFLAVVDILVLYTGLLRHWVIEITDYDVRTFSSAACTMHVWATYTTTYISAWLLVAVTMERSGVVWFPHRARSLFTKRLTLIVILAIITFMTILNCHYFYGLGDYLLTVDNQTVVVPCDNSIDSYHDFERNVWPWVDFCIYSVIPSSIMIICNVSIVYKVVSSDRNSVLHGHNSNENVANSSSSVSRRSQTSYLTATLVATSTTYVLCTTPFCIYVIYSNVFHFYEAQDIYAIAIEELVLSVVNMLQYINNAINFILYCVCGQRFRDELRALVCGAKRRTSRISSLPLRHASAGSSTVSAVSTSVAF